MALFTRYDDNPIIQKSDLPFPASSVYNPGAVEFDGQVLLLLRVEDCKGFSRIHVARSDNGVDAWEIEPEPLMDYGEPEMRYETLGVEDPRVTHVAEDDCYYICYVAYSGMGPAVGLARTADFQEVQRIGLVFGPTNKDTVMFPEKFDGNYWVLHRPAYGDQEHIWSARSPDLIHWGWPHCVVPERGGPWWDGLKVGGGTPPIKTDLGWLIIYHGVKEFAGQSVYRAGVALLDLEQPHKLLARSPGWVFGPEALYEQRGITPNIVFPTGALVRDGEIWMYYGAADTSCCLARADLQDVLGVLEVDTEEEQQEAP
jgi:predicted GH43/DUF377 family glycosyl hydrolase